MEHIIGKEMENFLSEKFPVYDFHDNKFKFVVNGKKCMIQCVCFEWWPAREAIYYSFYIDEVYCCQTFKTLDECLKNLLEKTL